MLQKRWRWQFCQQFGRLNLQGDCRHPAFKERVLASKNQTLRHAASKGRMLKYACFGIRLEQKKKLVLRHW
jgi:hypothetical protein